MAEKDEIDDVIDVVAAFYGVPREAIQSPSRVKAIHRARCMAMYLCHRTGLDTREIGRRFGGRDYMIVEAICRNMERRIIGHIPQRSLARELEIMSLATTRKRNLSNG